MRTHASTHTHMHTCTCTHTRRVYIAIRMHIVGVHPEIIGNPVPMPPELIAAPAPMVRVLCLKLSLK